MTPKQLRVLVVDDDSIDIEIVSHALRDIRAFEADIVSASDSQSCRETLDSEPIDCLLLDYRLSGESGLETLSRIREAGCDTPVVMLTGHGDERVAVESMKRGAQDYLVKGRISSDALERSISNAVHKVALERRVQEKREELERFVSVVAHDLKNPICSALNSIEVVTDYYRDKPLDAQGLDFARSAARSLRRMGKLVESLLGYSRVGRTRSPLRNVRLEDVARDAMSDLQAAIEESGASVEVGNLPQVTGDPVALRQLLQNLINNALKFCGDEAPRVAVSAQREEGETGWRISVHDNGIGIAAKHHQAIFEPFNRLHGRDLYEGSGVGLATCRKIVEHHGGKIWVESQPERGSTFRFTLHPAGETVDPEGAISVESVRVRSETNGRPRRRNSTSVTRS